MQSRLFFALPVLLMLQGCGEQIEDSAQPSALPDEIGAAEPTETPDMQSRIATAEIEPQDLARFD